MNRLHFVLLLLTIGLNGRLLAQKNIVPGKIDVPYPTLIHLAFEWYFEGDNNNNSSATIMFRENSAADWREGMPLRRIEKGEYEGFQWKNRYSGSLFDLKPGTQYEIRLTISDPDGGGVERTVEVATRKVPDPRINTEIIDIEPGDYDTLVTKSGTPEKPVVYTCSSGGAKFQYVDLRYRKHVFIQGLNIENLSTEGIGIGMDGAVDCSIIGNNIHAVYGIVADIPGATNCYVSNNIITGTCKWALSSLGNDGENIGEGIQLTGPGNVICYNRVSAFRDCISTMEGVRATDQVCVDIYNNDISQGVDDAIEADFCASNCRIVRNRITDCCVGLSSQPSLGGPTYFIRNVMYNIVHSGFKLKRFSRGDVVLHNTLVKIGVGLGGNSKMDYAYFRNNLTFGGPTYGIIIPGGYDTGRPFAADIIEPGAHSDFDYDAVGVWGTKYAARIGKKRFGVVEKNGIERLDIGKTFSNVPLPEKPLNTTNTVPDLRPSHEAKVIDRAQIIPNINDRFTGAAPDIGAYEEGSDLPQYGPTL
ncbi:MAG: right-handed parallel beta-helix repeat-containing protein [Chitinophagaceae bacterium]|nr:right-handed parallel beta-helix repeat-containing protein [Chitinophagaceae bacterium]